MKNDIKENHLTCLKLKEKHEISFMLRFSDLFPLRYFIPGENFKEVILLTKSCTTVIASTSDTGDKILHKIYLFQVSHARFTYLLA